MVFEVVAVRERVALVAAVVDAGTTAGFRAVLVGLAGPDMGLGWLIVVQGFTENQAGLSDFVGEGPQR